MTSRWNTLKSLTNNKHFSLQKHSANGGCRQTEFYCEECGKNIKSYNGLMVRWHFYCLGRSLIHSSFFRTDPHGQTAQGSHWIRVRCVPQILQIVLFILLLTIRSTDHSLPNKLIPTETYDRRQLQTNGFQMPNLSTEFPTSENFEGNAVWCVVSSTLYLHFS